MHSPQGDLDISDGKADGDQASWTGALTQPMPITLEFKATLDGDSHQSGDVNLGSVSAAPPSRARAPDSRAEPAGLSAPATQPCSSRGD
jgi:hypothetical protein